MYFLLAKCYSYFVRLVGICNPDLNILLPVPVILRYFLVVGGHKMGQSRVFPKSGIPDYW